MNSYTNDSSAKTTAEELIQRLKAKRQNFLSEVEWATRVLDLAIETCEATEAKNAKLLEALAEAECVFAKYERIDDELEQLRDRLAVAEAERNRLASAIDQVIRSQPCSNEGTLFYPRFDPDGNELGIEYVDPLSVLGGIYIELAAALAAKSEGKP